MKITRVQAHVLEAPLTQPFSWSFNSTSKRGSCIVEIATDTGIEGWGECIGPPELNGAIQSRSEAILAGRNPQLPFQLA